MKILLSSNSSTRKKILTNIGIKFNQKKPQVDEEKLKNKLLSRKTNPKKICQILAKEKALSNSNKFPQFFCIGTDSCLIFKNRFLSKPFSKKEAKKILVMLNGKHHTLYSSIFIAKDGKKIWSYNDEAVLKLHQFSNKDIDLYIKKLNILSIKTSGLYQIEGVGISLFEKIEGNFFTILGLPVIPLLNFLRKKKINAWK